MSDDPTTDPAPEGSAPAEAPAAAPAAIPAAPEPAPAPEPASGNPTDFLCPSCGAIFDPVTNMARPPSADAEKAKGVEVQLAALSAKYIEQSLELEKLKIRTGTVRRWGPGKGQGFTDWFFNGYKKQPAPDTEPTDNGK